MGSAGADSESAPIASAIQGSNNVDRAAPLRAAFSGSRGEPAGARARLCGVRAFRSSFGIADGTLSATRILPQYLHDRAVNGADDLVYSVFSHCLRIGPSLPGLDRFSVRLR